jgi:hypothetical protein
MPTNKDEFSGTTGRYLYTELSTCAMLPVLNRKEREERRER